MTPRHIRTRKTSQGNYGIFLERARQCFEAAKEVHLKHPLAGAIDAVHCAIAAADALLVFERGERAAGDSHGDAIELLSRLGVEGCQEKARQFGKIISLKNQAE